MNKIVIVINGNGGVGKDTLCDFAGEAFNVMVVSSVTPIKEIAAEYGWKGEKDAKSRKFLAELKRIFIEYNDLPCRYLVKEYEKFLDSDAEILFVHIREGAEIDKFKQFVDVPCITLLVCRNTKQMENWGNAADDNVEKYAYDFHYNNDKPLEEAKNDFLSFLKMLMKESGAAV